LYVLQHSFIILTAVRQYHLFGFSFNGQRRDYVFIEQPSELEALPRLKPSIFAVETGFHSLVELIAARAQSGIHPANKEGVAEVVSPDYRRNIPVIYIKV
jgi:hypothetical protein